MNKAYGMLGLAQKAGRLVFGEDSIRKAIKSGKATLVIVAEDASDNSKKRFTDSCAFYKSELILWGTKDELGRATGKNERAAVAVCDKNLARAILDKIHSAQDRQKSDESNTNVTNELKILPGGELIE